MVFAKDLYDLSRCSDYSGFSRSVKVNWSVTIGVGSNYIASVVPGSCWIICHTTQTHARTKSDCGECSGTVTLSNMWSMYE